MRRAAAHGGRTGYIPIDHGQHRTMRYAMKLCPDWANRHRDLHVGAGDVRNGSADGSDDEGYCREGKGKESRKTVARRSQLVCSGPDGMKVIRLDLSTKCQPYCQMPGARQTVDDRCCFRSEFHAGAGPAFGWLPL
jgi:hypothetical protein